MTWLVTGGAGYIGAHVVRAFREAGEPVVVIDSLTSGHAEFVPDDVPFVRGTLLDGDLVRHTLVEHDVSGVVHLAGFKYAGVSVSKPLLTYQQNVAGTATLLEQMAAAGVARIVFSSSAATYGTPDVDLVTERTPTHPESPYGESKLIGEWLIADQARAAKLGGTDFAHTSLRYFNVVGRRRPTCTTPARTTSSRSCSGCWPGARRRGSTATTTTPRTAPASATTCTWPTSRTPTSSPPTPWRPGPRSSPSTTSAAATASRSARSWTWPRR